MTMLFDTEQYQQPLQQNDIGDWDGGRYDPAWDEPDDIPLECKEVSTTVEVLQESQSQENSITKNDFTSSRLPTAYCRLPNLQEREEIYQHTSSHSLNPERKKKSSDRWYTPPYIVELVVQVLGEIDLDPCADDGKHIKAKQHYTEDTDGLVREWEGRVFMNPPYSQPGVWMEKLQAEIKSKRVTEAIALVPAATDTKWLSPVLKSQPVCFWTGRIKFLSEDYQPRNSARQSHVLVYWGLRKERFREVFEPHGFVSLPSHFLEDKPTDRISSRKVREDEEFPLDKSDKNISSRKTSDSENFPLDKLTDKISSRKVYEDEKFPLDKSDKNISSRKTGNSEKFLEDKLTDKISSRKVYEDEKFPLDKSDKNISSRKTGNSEKFLEDKLTDKISSREVYEDEEFLEDNSADKISSRKTRRHKGDGSGCIYYRTVTKKGKEYCEAYYQYEIWVMGDRLIKSSRYIPKGTLSKVQRMEVEKAPVKEILRVLRIKC
jgi:phage N-6-adenine-methyltransferase